MHMLSHSDDSLICRTVPHSASALAHARPTMSRIPLVRFIDSRVTYILSVSELHH